MKFNKWTLTLAGAGVVSLGAVAHGEEKPMSQVLTGVSQTTLSGYVDTSAMWFIGPASPQSAVQLPGRAFDGANKINGFNLDVIELTLEKPLSEDQWAAGYNVQLLFGPDAIGYDPSISNTGATSANSDFAIKQAYVAMRVPVGTGLDLKMGVFNTIIGYESFESYLNPNFSRSYGWQLEPTQNTGLLGSYKFTESFSVQAGVANTWTAGTNTRPAPQPQVDGGDLTFMAAAALTAPESWGSLKGSALYGGIVYGNATSTSQTTSSYIGATVATPVEGLAVGAAFDYRNNGGANLLGSVNNYAWALAGYVTFQASEKWKLAGRYDFTQASAGTWFNSTGNPNYGGNPTDTQKLAALTLTADYSLWENVITRAEFRWDHSATGQSPFGESGGNPAGNKDAYTLAANVIYKF